MQVHLRHDYFDDFFDGSFTDRAPMSFYPGFLCAGITANLVPDPSVDETCVLWFLAAKEAQVLIPQ